MPEVKPKTFPDPDIHRCGACHAGRHTDCSGWCFCPCDEGRLIPDEPKTEKR
jgi:hypothetical protein